MPAIRQPLPRLSDDAILSLSKDDMAALRRALLAWHRRHALRAPWRETRDPYHVLVAAVMAQQTQMSRVLPKFDEFIAAFPTVEKLARARTARVLRVWEGMGYNLRALRLHRAAKLIVRNGAFPETAAELVEIDGIGPFTATIISSFAFGERAAAIDTNVRRVIARLSGDADVTLSDQALQPAADALISHRAPGRWNQAIMDLGGRVCVSRRPKCDVCPIARWCCSRAEFEKSPRKIAERRASYRPRPRFEGSRRYYRGRIVQALRELPAGASLSQAELLRKMNATPPAGRASAFSEGRASARQTKAHQVQGRQAKACPSEEKSSVDHALLAELVDALQRDRLLHIEPNGRVRLP